MSSENGLSPNSMFHLFHLFFYYLFISSGSSSGRLRRGSSRVGFVPNQVNPPSDVPLDLTDELFEIVEDVQSFTLQPAQLAVVIASYDKTIRMYEERVGNFQWLNKLVSSAAGCTSLFVCLFFFGRGYSVDAEIREYELKNIENK